MGSAAAAEGSTAVIDMVQEWKGMGDRMVKSIINCFSGIESREKNLRLANESLENRERELEESKALLERRSEDLSMREENLDEQLRLVHEHIEGLEAYQGEVECLRRKQCEKLKEIENKEILLDVDRGLLERELDEVGKKLEELASKEEIFCKAKREFAEEVKLANEKLMEKQKMGYDLISRLESALDVLGGMKVIIDDRLKEIESREIEAYEFSISKLNEADSIRELMEKRFEELENIEKELNSSQDTTRNLVSKEQLLDTTLVDTVKLKEEKEKSSEQQKLRLQMVENEPEELTQELELKQKNALSRKKKHNYEKHDCREKNVSSVRESLQTRAKENLALCKRDLPQAQLVKSQTEVNFGEGQEVKLEIQSTTDDGLATKPDKSADLGQELQKDRKTLEILIIDHDRGLELMDSEIYRILSLSSDPANLVLYTVQGFYTLCLGKLDTEYKLRRAIILLLEQLTKMSPNIQHSVTVAAVNFAFEWKSKLRSCVEDPMETLGFLHFVAAFRISSRFNKNELFDFLKLVGQHKQTPELCLTLGLTSKIPGYIQHLINRKEYLLASTYIQEYRFMNIDLNPAAILYYFVVNSKLSAIARARNEGNSSEARDKAIAGEITDLLAGRAHIIKYGLEYAYSPNLLTARIHQLESDLARLRHGFPSSSAPADVQKQGNQKSKRKTRRKRHQICLTGYPCAPTMPHPGPDSPYKRHRPNSRLNSDHRGFGNQY